MHSDVFDLLDYSEVGFTVLFVFYTWAMFNSRDLICESFIEMYELEYHT